MSFWVLKCNETKILKYKIMNTLKIILLFVCFLVSTTFTLAQNNQKIGLNPGVLNASAVLELESTSKGFLPPRMTMAQRDLIALPAIGLIIFCTDVVGGAELQIFTISSSFPAGAWAALNKPAYGVPTVPGTPTVSISSSEGVIVSFGLSTSGGDILNANNAYTLRSNPGNFTYTGFTSPIRITNLTPGTSYTFTVVATNVVGSSASSGASNSVSYREAPGPPTSPVASAGYDQVSVSFTAPASNGGSAITSYTATSSPGNISVTGSSSPLTFKDLTNGTFYTFTVVATNAVGNSVVSVAAASATPKACGAIVGGTYKEFMCYNLGVTGTQDALSYQGGANNGSIYQWGRQTDGYEVRGSSTQVGPVSAAVAGKFITSSVSPNDWISPQNDSLWLDGSKTANDPCPAGYRVPTQAQWGGLFRDGITNGAPGTATRNTWTWTGSGYNIGGNLYLPAAGFRRSADGALFSVTTNAIYGSSTVNSTTFYSLTFGSSTVDPGYIGAVRALGISVRCISE
jgi:uncharacterized protein (TIGR02145 family)